jgi:hypothetical protein
MNVGFQRVKGILKINYSCQSVKVSLTKAAQVNRISVARSCLKYEYKACSKKKTELLL